MKTAAAALLAIALPAFGAAAAAQEGDPMRGKRAFFTCYACHYVGKNLPHHTGPNLYGIFGRKAGTAEGYAYSDTLKNSGITWSPEELSRWLADPKGYLPGSRMVFIAVPDAQERAHLIAYLQSLMDGE